MPELLPSENAGSTPLPLCDSGSKFSGSEIVPNPSLAMLATRELDYPLPPAAVATRPAEPRESARLMVIDRTAGTVEHRNISDLPTVFRPGDLLVMNASRVIPARFEGHREDTRGGVEGLFLTDVASEPGTLRWHVMLKARRLRAGMRVLFQPPISIPSSPPVTLTLVGRAAATDHPVAPELAEMPDGTWIVEVHGALPGESSVAVLERCGRTPLPPYIRAARKREGIVVTDSADRAAYQTVFADANRAGSVAAPTAGLHLTAPLLASLRARGVQTAEVCLHVGAGTFKPVETEFIEQHPMHAEWAQVPADVGRAILSAKREGRRVIAIGTTSARAIESFTDADLQNDAAKWTRILITPGYRWQHVTAMMTNFHLPQSTLMAMVGALLPGGVAELKRHYATALERDYRFFSYGDAMVVA